MLVNQLYNLHLNYSWDVLTTPEIMQKYLPTNIPSREDTKRSDALTRLVRIVKLQ